MLQQIRKRISNPFVSFAAGILLGAGSSYLFCRYCPLGKCPAQSRSVRFEENKDEKND